MVINEVEFNMDGSMIGIVFLIVVNGGKVGRVFDMVGGGYIFVGNFSLMNMEKFGGIVVFWMNSYIIIVGNFLVLVAKGYDVKRVFEFCYYGFSSIVSMQNNVCFYF